MLYDCNFCFQHNPRIISQCLSNLVYLTVGLWLDDGFTSDQSLYNHEPTLILVVLLLRHVFPYCDGRVWPCHRQIPVSQAMFQEFYNASTEFQLTVEI